MAQHRDGQYNGDNYSDQEAARQRLAELEKKMEAKERKKRLLAERARLQAELAAGAPASATHDRPSIPPADPSYVRHC